MTEPLCRLIYHSRNRLDAGSDAEVARILTASRVNNARVGVTGALMFNRGYFVQVLEGPRDAVEVTFERIQHDERHGAVSLISIEQVSNRGFSNWAMAYVGPDGDGPEYLAEVSGFDPSRLTGEAVLELLHQQLRDYASA